MNNWQPSASLENLKARSKLNQVIRQFFSERHFLEVELPVLSRIGTTDPHIKSWQTISSSSDIFYLQTSPEFFMKRLLAAGSGSIYALTKAFRQEESGRFHNPEFSILEWYRPGFDDHQLMQQVTELISGLLPVEVQFFCYRDLFEQTFGIDPHLASEENLSRCAERHFSSSWKDATKSVWLDAMFSLVIQPQLPSGLVFVHDYPQEQAALAKILPDELGQLVARRFEAFLNGVELANGYWELTDSVEQQQRFERDNAQRRDMNLEEVAIDSKLVGALEFGMPEVAGVALGVDRLLMEMLGAESIEDVIGFPFSKI